MTTTIFRSRHGQYQCGSTDKGEALAKFFDGKLETEDAALAERLTKQPGFSATPGAGDFWIDGPATAQANSVPKQPESTGHQASGTGETKGDDDPSKQNGEGGDQGKSSPETVPPADPKDAKRDGAGKKGGKGDKGAKAPK